MSDISELRVVFVSLCVVSVTWCEYVLNRNMSFDLPGLCLGKVLRCESSSGKCIIAVMSDRIALRVVFVESRGVTNRCEYLE